MPAVGRPVPARPAGSAAAEASGRSVHARSLHRPSRSAQARPPCSDVTDGKVGARRDRARRRSSSRARAAAAAPRGDTGSGDRGCRRRRSASFRYSASIATSELNRNCGSTCACMAARRDSSTSRATAACSRRAARTAASVADRRCRTSATSDEERAEQRKMDRVAEDADPERRHGPLLSHQFVPDLRDSGMRIHDRNDEGCGQQAAGDDRKHDCPHPLRAARRLAGHGRGPGEQRDGEQRDGDEQVEDDDLHDAGPAELVGHRAQVDRRHQQDGERDAERVPPVQARPGVVQRASCGACTTIAAGTSARRRSRRLLQHQRHADRREHSARRGRRQRQRGARTRTAPPAATACWQGRRRCRRWRRSPHRCRARRSAGHRRRAGRRCRCGRLRAAATGRA